MALDNTDYWLDKYLNEASCGTRNRTGMLLAAQLRDNRVPKADAKSVMKQYAEEVPDCGDPYTKSEAMATLRNVYSSEKREPCSAKEDQEHDGIEKRARERERNLLRQFKQDPLSLSDMERKRLSQSDVHNLPIDLYEIELAKQHMTRNERAMFNFCCNTSGRTYSWTGTPDPESVCDCGRAEFKVREADSFRKRQTTMVVDFDEVTSEVLREVADKIKCTALQRRQSSYGQSELRRQPN